jgi:hypothetical protein
MAMLQRAIRLISPQEGRAVGVVQVLEYAFLAHRAGDFALTEEALQYLEEGSVKKNRYGEVTQTNAKALKFISHLREHGSSVAL